MSLFLLLLAFFILLNSLAQFEERKARAVIRSVAETFQSEIVPDYRAEVIIPVQGRAPLPQEVTEALEKLWLTAFPVARVDQLMPGRTLQIAMPAVDAFAPSRPALREDRAGLVAATAGVLARPPEDHVVHAQVLLGAPRFGAAPAADPSEGELEDPLGFSGGGALASEDVLRALEAEARAAPDRPGAGELAFQRAVAFARALEGAGAPPDAVSVGVKEGEAGALRVRFFIRPRAESFVTFAAAGEEGALP